MAFKSYYSYILLEFGDFQVKQKVPGSCTKGQIHKQIKVKP